MTTALGLAAIAVAIDHTRHKLPTPIPSSTHTISNESSSELEPPGEEGNESPCSLGNPCALNIAPCALD
jgi:hypothetical protein